MKARQRRDRYTPSYETRYRLAKTYGYPMPRPSREEELEDRIEALELSQSELLSLISLVSQGASAAADECPR